MKDFVNRQDEDKPSLWNDFVAILLIAIICWCAQNVPGLVYDAWVYNQEAFYGKGTENQPSAWETVPK